jgi:hypothetical protein
MYPELLLIPMREELTKAGVQELHTAAEVDRAAAAAGAGQDTEATERARSYFTGYPPSSPPIGILRDGKLVYMLQRSQIGPISGVVSVGGTACSLQSAI